MIKVVNMIPASLSGETNQDSEPNLSVNPNSPLQMAATAFTPDPAGTAKAPIFVSLDGGQTWQLNATVPHGNTGTGTGDITIRFATKGNSLYTGDLRGDVPAGTTMDVLRAANFAAATLMTQLESHGGTPGPDQPWLEAATVAGGAGAGKDRVYVGNNDLSAPAGKTATIDLSLDAKAAPAVFSRVRLEKRSTGTANQDGFQIRIAIHSSGVIYAAFYGWRARNSATGIVTADVVVVRDDNWGTGASPFTSLKDAADHLSGLRVVKNVTISINGTLGQNRLGGDLAIAVDPTDNQRVFLAFGDQAGSTATLHIRRSTDSGVTWGADLLTLKSAVSPGLAINTSGEIGLLYQQVTGSGATQRWVTHFRHSADGLLWDDSVLATTPANQPTSIGQPYLGDYLYLAASGTDFCGVFCANNTPDNANFPNGVKFQRKANFTTKRLLTNAGTGNVAVSIDPFFFKVTAEGTSTPAPGTGTPTAAPGTGTPTVAPGTGTPTVAPGTGTPTAAPGTGTPTVAPGTGTPTAAPGTGTPTAAPGTGTPTAAPGTGTPTVAPGTGTPTAAPGTGTPTAAPGTGTPTVAPGTGTPTAAPGTGTPTVSPGTGTPSPTPAPTHHPPTHHLSQGRKMLFAPHRRP